MFFLIQHRTNITYNLEILHLLIQSIISCPDALDKLHILEPNRNTTQINLIWLNLNSPTQVYIRPDKNGCTTFTTSKSNLIELILTAPNFTTQDYILIFDGYKFTVKPYDPDLAHKLISYYLNQPLTTRNITPNETYYNSNQKHMELLFTILEGMSTLKDNLAEITLAATSGNTRKGFVIKDEVGIQIVQQGYLSLFNLCYYNLYQFEYQALMSLVRTGLSLPDANGIPNLEILKSNGYLIVHDLDK